MTGAQMSDVSGLPPKALLLGRVDRPGMSPAASPGFLTSDDDSHLLTIAPNRSGRNRSCLIPNLLAYRGQAVVIDLDGEAYAATADARRAMGHVVVRLDPFGVTGPETDALNPLDLLDGLEQPALESACQDVADLFPLPNSLGDMVEREAFGLLSGLIGYHFTIPEKRSFDQIYSTFHSDDVVYSLAVVLDTTGKILPKMSMAEISSFVEREDKARGRVLAKLRSHCSALASTEVQRSLTRSTVPLSEILSGAPVTIYIVIPAVRLAAHSLLLRIWIGTLLHGLSRSRRRDSLPTLFLLDHSAELGTFPLLDSLLRLVPGDTFRIWTFWHDVYQLRTAYPADWPGIVAGCGVVQAFGSRDSAAAAEAEALLGLSPNDVGSLGPGEQIVRLDGVSQRARRLDSPL